MSQLIRIGNSRGIRIPAALIEQVGLDNGDLVLKAVEGGLLIQVKPASPKASEGWEAAFDKALAGRLPLLDQEDRDWLEADLSEQE